jgi:hypothetical protein
MSALYWTGDAAAKKTYIGPCLIFLHEDNNILTVEGGFFDEQQCMAS